VLAYFGEDIGAMMGLLDRALALNPSFARGWYLSGIIRRFGAKPRKNFVDDQAASPSSWKTPRMAVWMAA